MPTDPLAALRQPVSAVEPRSEFVAALRARLETSLRPPPDVPIIDLPQRRRPMTTTTTDAAPAGPTVTAAHPRLTVTGATRAIAFYREVFGAEVMAEPVIQADGRVGHAELRIGGLTVALADAYPEMGFPSPIALGGTPIGISIEVASPAEVDQLFDRAVAAGATGTRPPEDQFHGRRAGTVIDPFGHRWNISAPLG